MRWILSPVLGLLTLGALGLHASTARAEPDSTFCADRDRGSLPATIERIADDPAMRLAFRNNGGAFGGGVCWWHSRLQRVAWYLAIYDESAPKPTKREAKELIRELVSRQVVVTIPGYADFVSFSKDFKSEIQSALDAWQIWDGFVNQAYIRDLSGRSSFRHPGEMAARMNTLYVEYRSAEAQGDILWLLLQMPGIGSHASLLRAMTPLVGGGYHLDVVDSNFPGTLVTYDYRPGDLDLNPDSVNLNDYTSVPYAGFTRDLTRIHRAISSYCSGK